MHKDDYLDGINFMRLSVGHFAQGIAQAAIHADSGNWALLSTAFKDLFEQYKRMAVAQTKEYKRG